MWMAMMMAMMTTWVLMTWMLMCSWRLSVQVAAVVQVQVQVQVQVLAVVSPQATTKRKCEPSCSGRRRPQQWQKARPTTEWTGSSGANAGG
jgi:hypothetical protein